MKTALIGLGVQGKKRLAVAGKDIVATVDTVAPEARHRTIDQVPIDSYEAALVCTPDSAKLEILDYLLSHGKHVLVEKPLFFEYEAELRRLGDTARATGAACYTAYNHRFEPHIMTLKSILEDGTLGSVYTARLYYGNGTARDIRESAWRDQGLGVLGDLGSHLLDLTLYLFGRADREFVVWSANRFETRSFDHVTLGSMGRPMLELESTYLCWRNTFTVDVLGELGSAHIDGLCKWGPSTLTLRHRVFPSGVPEEKVETIERSDPTWAAEYDYFKQLCHRGGSNIENDRCISAWLSQASQCVSQVSPA